MKFCNFLFVFCLIAQVAAAQSRIDKSTIQCIFQAPLEVGASVTGRVGESIPFYSAAERLLFNVKNAQYRGSPSLFFIAHYRSQNPEEFARFVYRQGIFRRRNLAVSVTNATENTGAGQIERLLDGDYRREFTRASIIIGVDLLYWDAIFDLCGYGIARTQKVRTSIRGARETRMDSEYQIERLISRSKKEGKTLILGTIPHENPNSVLINSEATGIPGFWYPQNYACVKSINETLRQHCVEKNRCYLADLGKMAEDLNHGKKVYLKSKNKALDLYEARPDGVHLSHLGSQAMAERMIEVFEKNPPTCGRQITVETIDQGRPQSPEGGGGAVEAR